MMSLQTKPLLTPEEYLALERHAEYKSEYVAGEVFALAGASERHNLIVGNVFAGLHTQFKQRPCKVYASDMRVKVQATGLYTYPDVVAVCHAVQFEDDWQDTLLNPTLIVEVLSESTEGYDRGKKFAHYRKLESLQEYVLIAQDTDHIEHYIRQPNQQWLLTESDRLLETIFLPSIDCQLVMADVYDKVEVEVE
jgi:Uma2 family endonuclease